MVAKLSHDKALDFILAGNCTFTAKNSETGNRFTYKIKKHKVNDVWFVSVLGGANNETDYFFFGSINKDGKYSFSEKSAKIGKDAKSVITFNYIFNRLLSNTLSPLVEIWHEGKCGKCGRKLTVPESVETGLGPECSKRVVSKDQLRENKINNLLYK
jgi:hypothetical protein